MIQKYEFFSNSYLVTNGQEAVLIDAGLPTRVIDDIRKKYSLKAVFLTHGHFDHIEGLKDLMDVDIYIHRDEEEFLYNSNLNLYGNMDHYIFKKGDLKIHSVLDNDIIKIIGYEFLVIHTPGHTRGSVCYKLDDNLFTGDTLFNLSIGRTDFPTGDYQIMKESLKKLKNLNEDLKVYPGHEENTTLFFEIKNNHFFGGTK